MCIPGSEATSVNIPLLSMFLISCKVDRMPLCWLAVHGKPVLFWKGNSGLKSPCFLFMHANGTGPFEFRAVPILGRLRNRPKPQLQRALAHSR